MFKYNEATHSIEQLPEMKEPECELSELDANAHPEFAERLIIEWDQYNERIASLKTYDVGVPKGKVPDYWKIEEQILGEKDFRVDVEYEDYEPDNRKTRLVAIPIEQNKDVIKPFDFDLLDKQIINYTL